MSKKKTVWMTVALLGVLSSVGFYVLTMSRPRRYLPWEATEIREYYHDYGIIPDFERCLRAKISEAGFQTYIKRLGLTKRYNWAVHKDLPISWPPCDEVWWTPGALDGAYFDHTEGEEFCVLAKYEDGYVYFAAFAW